MEPIRKRQCLGQSSLEVDCCQQWQECSSGSHPLGDVDRRAATGKVGYSKPNQGKHWCIRF